MKLNFVTRLLIKINTKETNKAEHNRDKYRDKIETSNIGGKLYMKCTICSSMYKKKVFSSKIFRSCHDSSPLK